MGSANGLSTEKIEDLANYTSSDHYDEKERCVLSYADHITLSDKDVDDALFTRLVSFFNEKEVLELTAIIAWENASSKFNRALRIPSQKLWKS